ncbi:uncharacterized protein LOC108903954 [Anoplophora glabripennis]|uniref:uncharacterized protein LOC108903954 n=1 Tax=Anoplophora glabripennis TaxID=217634 RepID=UPI00087523B7|nr:uncharacterized protein LOC108903954 [Anoplophora glabripennis]
MATRTRYYGVYVGVIALLAFHVEKEPLFEFFMSLQIVRNFSRESTFIFQLKHYYTFTVHKQPGHSKKTITHRKRIVSILDSAVPTFYLNGLRPIIQWLKPKVNDYDTGYAVKCYSCSSKNLEACIKPDDNEYTPVHCDITRLEEMKNNSKYIHKEYEKIFDVDTQHLVGVDLVCLKVVVQEGNKKYVLRGCQLGLHSNLDICKKVAETSTGMYKMIHCSKCNKDGCNSSLKSFQFNAALTLICLVFYQAVSGL